MATREGRIDAGRDAGQDAEKEDAARKEERPGTDDARADTRAASALIPPSLNIWVPPVETCTASAGPSAALLCRGCRNASKMLERLGFLEAGVGTLQRISMRHYVTYTALQPRNVSLLF